MRLRLAAAACASIVMIGVMHAPALPVMIGAAAAYGWLICRSMARRASVEEEPMARPRRFAHR